MKEAGEYTGAHVLRMVRAHYPCNTWAQCLIGLNRILIPTSCNFFSRSTSLKNSKVKRAWPRAMGDRPESSSRVRTSEDKVRRKDKCWSVRAFYILVRLSDVSGPSLGEVGRYIVKVPLDALTHCIFI